MNTKAKGAALERRFMDLLEDMGYITEKARAVYMQRMAGPPRATAHDLFGAFDVVGKKAGERTLWIQITTDNVSIASKARTFRHRAASWFTPDFDDVWIVRWKKPAKPGERGVWQIAKWDDDFDPRKAWLIKSDAHTWPWEEVEE